MDFEAESGRLVQQIHGLQEVVTALEEQLAALQLNHDGRTTTALPRSPGATFSSTHSSLVETGRSQSISLRIRREQERSAAAFDGRHLSRERPLLSSPPSAQQRGRATSRGRGGSAVSSPPGTPLPHRAARPLSQASPSSPAATAAAKQLRTSPTRMTRRIKEVTGLRTPADKHSPPSSGSVRGLGLRMGTEADEFSASLRLEDDELLDERHSATSSATSSQEDGRPTVSASPPRHFRSDISAIVSGLDGIIDGLRRPLGGAARSPGSPRPRAPLSPVAASPRPRSPAAVSRSASRDDSALLSPAAAASPQRRVRSASPVLTRRGQPVATSPVVLPLSPRARPPLPPMPSPAHTLRSAATSPISFPPASPRPSSVAVAVETSPLASPLGSPASASSRRSRSSRTAVEAEEGPPVAVALSLEWSPEHPADELDLSASTIGLQVPSLDPPNLAASLGRQLEPEAGAGAEELQFKAFLRARRVTSSATSSGREVVPLGLAEELVGRYNAAVADYNELVRRAFHQRHEGRQVKAELREEITASVGLVVELKTRLADLAAVNRSLVEQVRLLEEERAELLGQAAPLPSLNSSSLNPSNPRSPAAAASFSLSASFSAEPFSPGRSRSPQRRPTSPSALRSPARAPPQSPVAVLSSRKLPASPSPLRPSAQSAGPAEPLPLSLTRLAVSVDHAAAREIALLLPELGLAVPSRPAVLGRSLSNDDDRDEEQTAEAEWFEAVERALAVQLADLRGLEESLAAAQALGPGEQPHVLVGLAALQSLLRSLQESRRGLGQRMGRAEAEARRAKQSGREAESKAAALLEICRDKERQAAVLQDSLRAEAADKRRVSAEYQRTLDLLGRQLDDTKRQLSAAEAAAATLPAGQSPRRMRSAAALGLDPALLSRATSSPAVVSFHPPDQRPPAPPTEQGPPHLRVPTASAAFSPSSDEEEDGRGEGDGADDSSYASSVVVVVDDLRRHPSEKLAAPRPDSLHLFQSMAAADFPKQTSSNPSNTNPSSPEKKQKDKSSPSTSTSTNPSHRKSSPSKLAASLSRYQEDLQFIQRSLRSLEDKFLARPAPAQALPPAEAETEASLPSPARSASPSPAQRRHGPAAAEQSLRQLEGRLFSSRPDESFSVAAEQRLAQLEERLRQEEGRSLLLAEQLQTMPASLTVAAAEKRVLEGKLAKAAEAYETNLQRVQTFAAAKVKEIETFLQLEVTLTH